MRRRGFQNGEFVIVLAVIVFGAAILTPVFQRGAQNRRRSNCQTNMRQIGLAMKQYLADNHERLPQLNGNRTYYGWADAIQPYLRSATFQCPSESTWPGDGDGPRARNYTDYFFNSNMSGQNESAVHPSTIMSGDAKSGDARRESNGGTNRLRQIDEIQRIVDRNGAPVGAAMRHRGGANYTFADGHVKWLKGSDANTTPAIRLVPSSANWISFD